MATNTKSSNGRKRREPLKPNGQIIEPGCFYPRAALCAVFGWRRDAWLAARVRGLRVLKVGTVEGCRSEDVISYFEENGQPAG